MVPPCGFYTEWHLNKDARQTCSDWTVQVTFTQAVVLMYFHLMPLFSKLRHHISEGTIVLFTWLHLFDCRVTLQIEVSHIKQDTVLRILLLFKGEIWHQTWGNMLNRLLILKSKVCIFPLAFTAIYPSGLFWCRLLNFEDITIEISAFSWI